jgi:GNAT superfamily N-acetyltransferase
MPVNIHQETLAALSEYASIPSRYEVSQILAPTAAESKMGGIALALRDVTTPYLKDYDADSGCGPLQWRERFDLTGWGIWIAREERRCVGGAAVALKDSQLKPRSDVAVLWDLRIAPEARRRGIATALFDSAEAWAKSKGALWLEIETQNVNVPACRFYVSRGCTLGAVHRFAYPSLPHEIRLLWYKALSDSADQPCPSPQAHR